MTGAMLRINGDDRMNKLSLITLALLLLLAAPLAAQVYVSPTGSDTNPGTIDLPFATISKALSSLGPDSLIYLRGGTYALSSKVTIGRIGRPGGYIRIWAYPGETPLFDFAGETSSDGIGITGRYIHLRGIEVVHAYHNGINVSGHYNIIENCSVHDNRNSGFQIGSSSGTAYPRGNLVLNCDSYMNYDAPIGGNADGFAIKWNIGSGNLFKGCRAFNNSDDGWDFWMADSSIELDSCFAFRNGVDSWHSGQFDGNGNGFKLGGNFVAVPHLLRNCVSFDNAKVGPSGAGRGYDENNNTAGQTLYNCTAYRNAGDNYHFTNSVTVGQHVIKNCISYQGVVNITSGTRVANSWQGFSVSDADFQSLDTSLAVAPRDSAGNLPANGFLRLADGSTMIDAGVFVGQPFNGIAPDLGAFENGTGIPRFIITASAGQHGSITPSGPVPVPQGQDTTFTMIPDPGYHVAGLMLDGDAIGPSTSYTFTSVQSNHTLLSLFAINQFTLSVEAANGTVIKSPDLAQYDSGSTVQVTALPAGGYHFTQWTGDVLPGHETDNPLSVLLDRNKALTAMFALDLYSVVLNPGWNLISLPCSVETEVAAMFPDAASKAFRYAGLYEPQDTVRDGIGYWLKYPFADTVIMAGMRMTADTISAVEGWNMIGAISYPAAVSSIASDPPGLVTSQFFEFQSGYVTCDTLSPGRGYWVKLSGPGSLVISATSARLSAGLTSARIRVVPTGDQPPAPPSGEMPGAGGTIPGRFLLYESFPNPFNPSTRISYDLPQSAHVKLAIYDVMGREVAALVDEMQDAGRRSVEWRAAGLPSGVYFCRLAAGNAVQIRKMLLMK